MEEDFPDSLLGRVTLADAVSRRELGWAATTPLRDGLARTIAAYREAG